MKCICKKDKINRCQCGTNNPFYGKKHSKELIAKISKKLRGRKLSKNTINKIRTFHKNRLKNKEERIKCGLPKEKNPNWKGGKYTDNRGYVLILDHSHPNCDIRGYIYEHRLIVEKHIGRYLSSKEVVHHINNIKNDNRIENLIFCTQSEHASIHNSFNK